MWNRFAGTNLRITVTALSLLLLSAAVTERIPVGGGTGWDGTTYARWTHALSLERLFSDRAERPDIVDVTTYNVRRVLVPVALHHAMRALGVKSTVENVITAYCIANVVLLTLAVLLWCSSADELSLGDRGKLIGLIALIVNAVNWKMPIFYPTLTDSAALAFGTAMLLCYLKRQQVALAAVTLAGGFVWPSVPYFGLLMIGFPAKRLESLETAPASLDRIVAGAAAAAATVCSVYLVTSGYNITPSRRDPILWLLPLSAGLVGAYVYLALAPLLASRDFWRDVSPWHAVRRASVWLSLLVFAAGALVVSAIDTSPAQMNAASAVAANFLTAVQQPGIFLVAHTVHYGPLVLLLLFLWRPISASIARTGTGLVLCFVLAVLLSAGSESRKLMNFYPAAVLFLAQAAAPIFHSRGRMLGLAVLSVFFSKIWLPMDGPLDLPGVGEIGWRTLYRSTQGPWIDDAWWAGQGILVLATAALFYAWCRHSGRDEEIGIDE